MNTKKELYLAIKGKLTDGAEPIVKHCALYNSQFDNMDSEDTFSFPCAFIEFTQLQWLTKSEGYQEADAIVRIHIGFESLKTEELDVLDLLETIHAKLQGFNVDLLFTPLDRNFEGQDTNHDNVIVWMMDYDTLLSDNSGNRNNKLVKTSIGSLKIDRDDTTGQTAPRLGEIRP